jgi:hypothetical protein
MKRYLQAAYRITIYTMGLLAIPAVALLSVVFVQLEVSGIMTNDRMNNYSIVEEEENSTYMSHYVDCKDKNSIRQMMVRGGMVPVLYGETAMPIIGGPPVPGQLAVSPLLGNIEVWVKQEDGLYFIVFTPQDTEYACLASKGLFSELPQEIYGGQKVSSN